MNTNTTQKLTDLELVEIQGGTDGIIGGCITPYFSSVETDENEQEIEIGCVIVVKYPRTR
jgi:hypothetical protein